MDFAFFEGLTRSEGLEFLDSFLRQEKVRVSEMLEAFRREGGVDPNFTVESAGQVLKWASRKVHTVASHVDSATPPWVRETESYARDLESPDEVSSVLMLRCAFYLGESFVRTYEHLQWATGSPEAAQQNQPVVSGFQSGLEMSVLLVCQNLLLRVAVDQESPDVIDRGLAFWAARA